MAIKTILFDWGGVCAKGKLAQVLSKQLAPKLKRNHKHITRVYLKHCHAYQKSEINAKQFWKRVQEELNTNMKHEHLVKHHINARKANKGIIEIIKKLRKHYKVMLVMNTYKEYFEHNNKKHGISKLFDEIIVSYKIKSRKSEPKMIKAALQKAKCKASECVLIDDKQKYLGIPRKMGMKAILYKNQKQLKQQLKKLGVTWK